MPAHRSSFRYLSIVIVTFGTIAVQGDPQQPKRPTEDPLAVPDFRPALEQLNERFDDIDREIKRLKAAGKDGEAAQLEVHLVNFKSWLKGPYRPPKGEEAEVHVVGIHEGQHPPGVRPMGDFNPPGKAEVKVTYSARPVILVICAYNPIQWHIQVDPRAEVERVIVGSYHAQEITGLGDKVPVSRSVHDEGGEGYFHAYKKDAEYYPRVVAAVRRLTSREITTFQGMYDYKGQPVIVGPESEEWRAEHALTRTTEVHRRANRFERERVINQMRPLRYVGLHFAEHGDITHSPSYGEISPLGPLATTLRPLPLRVRQLAIDPKTGRLFGLEHSEVFEIDVVKKSKTSLAMPKRPDLPELSHPRGLTFDSKRRRLLLCSLGGEGFLYAYDLDKKVWSLVSSMNNIDLAAITYSSDDDLLYGLGERPGDERPNSIHVFNAAGALLREIQLSQPLFTRKHDFHRQLAAVNGQLIITSQLHVNAEDPNALGLATVAQVVDLKTGKLVFSTRQAFQQPSKP